MCYDAQTRTVASIHKKYPTHEDPSATFGIDKRPETESVLTNVQTTADLIIIIINCSSTARDGPQPLPIWEVTRSI